MCYYYYYYCITKGGQKERNVLSQNMAIFSCSPIILRVSTAVLSRTKDFYHRCAF